MHKIQNYAKGCLIHQELFILGAVMQSGLQALFTHSLFSR